MKRSSLGKPSTARRYGLPDRDWGNSRIVHLCPSLIMAEPVVERLRQPAALSTPRRHDAGRGLQSSNAEFEAATITSQMEDTAVSKRAFWLWTWGSIGTRKTL